MSKETLSHPVQKPLVCSGHSRPVPFVSYSNINEADDSFYMISGCLDGKAMLRVGKTGDWVGTFLGHKGAVYGAQLNKNATKAITGSADYTAKVWDATTGAELHSFEHKKIVKAVDFAPAGDVAVTGGTEGLLRLYDLNKPDTAPTVLTGHNGMIRRVLCTAEHSIVTAGVDGSVRLWDVRSGKVAHEAKLGGDVRDVSLSVGHASDDQALLVCTSGRVVSFVKATDLSIVKQHTVRNELTTGALNVKDGRFLAAGGDFWAKVYDYQNGTLSEVHKGHHGPLHCMRVAPDLATYCSASEDGTIRLWQFTIGNYGLWVLNENAPSLANVASPLSPKTTTIDADK